MRQGRPVKEEQYQSGLDQTINPISFTLFLAQLMAWLGIVQHIAEVGMIINCVTARYPSVVIRRLHIIRPDTKQTYTAHQKFLCYISA